MTDSERLDKLMRIVRLVGSMRINSIQGTCIAELEIDSLDKLDAIDVEAIERLFGMTDQELAEEGIL